MSENYKPCLDNLSAEDVAKNVASAPRSEGAREWLKKREKETAHWVFDTPADRTIFITELEAYAASRLAAAEQRNAELIGKAAEFDAVQELPLPNFIESEIAPYGLPLYGRIKMLLDEKAAAESLLAEARQAIEKLTSSVRELSIHDAAHRSRIHCTVPLPVKQWADVNDATVSAESLLSKLKGERA